MLNVVWMPWQPLPLAAQNDLAISQHASEELPAHERVDTEACFLR